MLDGRSFSGSHGGNRSDRRFGGIRVNILHGRGRLLSIIRLSRLRVRKRFSGALTVNVLLRI